MKITVNGTPREIDSPRLSDTLTELGFSGSALATALNGEFVAAAARTSATLHENDRLEVLAPMQGG